MNRTLRVILILWVVVILAIAASAAFSQQPPAGEVKKSESYPVEPQNGAEKKDSSAPSAPSAVKPPAVQPAPAAFLKGWEQLESIVELRGEQQRKREQAIAALVEAQISISSLNGQASELSRQLQPQIPAGFEFDPQQRAFVPKKNPTAEAAKGAEEKPKPQE